MTGEPGCVFLDRVNEDNPLPTLGRIEASNPCGEQFLHDGDVCNLGAVNATKAFNPQTNDLDEAKLRLLVCTGVMMLEDAIDTFKLPVDKVKQRSLQTRRVGLGVMGWAEYLILRGIPYDSKENITEIIRFMTIFKDEAIKTTRQLAKERGVFPLWKDSVYSSTGDRRRNAFLSSCAPTGTTSMLADLCGGIEPLFKVSYIKHNILGGAVMTYLNPLLMKALKDAGLDGDKELVENIKQKGTVAHLADKLPEHIVRVFRTSEAVSPDWHVRVQATFQRFIDNAISKTCNFPEQATVQDVVDAYIKAWKLRCKGLTVYRANSRFYEVLSTVEDVERKHKAAKRAAEEETDLKQQNGGGELAKAAMVVATASIHPVSVAAPPSSNGGSIHHNPLAMSVDGAEKAGRKYRPVEPDGSVKRATNCPLCENHDNIVHAEGCMKCTACGWSAC